MKVSSVMNVTVISTFPGGGEIRDSVRFSEVLLYNAATQQWVKTGDLQTPRFQHAVTSVDWDVIQPFCKLDTLPVLF